MTPLEDVILKQVGIKGVFETEVSKTGLKPEWYKGDNQLRRGDVYDIVSEGCKHQLVVEEAKIKDEGQYKVKFGDISSEAKLIIQGNFFCLYYYYGNS